MDGGWVRRQVMAVFEVGGGDEDADFGMQVKADSTCTSSGLGSSAKPRDDRLSGGSTLHGVFKRFAWLVRSPGRRRGPGYLARWHWPSRAPPGGSCRRRLGRTRPNCLNPSSASSSRLTVHVSMASARLASSPRRSESAAGRLVTLARDHRSEKAVQGRMGPTAPNFNSWRYQQGILVR